MGLRIQLLGSPAIIDAQGERMAVRGLQAWALLARILLSERALSRREVAAELFPEADDPLGSLRWCLASLRRALGSAEALTGDPIAANLPSGAQVDVHRIESDDFDVEAAGDLLAGIEPRCSPEFATWLLIERERMAALIDERLRQAAMQAIAVRDYGRAIRLAELGVRRLPFDESAHILLAKSLALAGSYDAALDHVQATERAFLAELGVKPSEALRSAARRTIASPPGGIGPSSVLKSLLESGLAALSAGAVDAGIDCLRRAVADAEAGNDRHLHAKALLELGTALVHAIRGYDNEGAILLRQSIEVAEQGSDAALATAALRELGYVEALAGRRPAAASHLKKALEIAEDAESLAGVHAVIGFNLVDWGKREVGLEHYETSLDYARSAQNRRREAWSLGVGGWGQLAAGEPETARRWFDDCLAIIEDLRWVAFRPWPLALQAEAQLKLDHDPKALRAGIEEAVALATQLGDPCWEATSYRVLALTYAAADDMESAFKWLTQARVACVREMDAYMGMLVAILADRAALEGRAGHAAQADSTTRELLSVAARTHMDTYVQWAAARIAS